MGDIKCMKLVLFSVLQVRLSGLEVSEHYQQANNTEIIMQHLQLTMMQTIFPFFLSTYSTHLLANQTYVACSESKK
jgi:hypothetical protein